MKLALWKFQGNRFHKENLNKIGLKPTASMQHRKDNKTIGYEQSRDGINTAANMDKGQAISFQLTGVSPQGEKDTLRVCQILVSRLNNSGGDWDIPILLNEGAVDCKTVNRKSNNLKLRFQVVRADVDQKLWETLSRKGIIETTQNIGVFVEKIKTSIDSKANYRKIPAVSRKGVTLVLDATIVPALSFDSVIEAFHKKWEHGLIIQDSKAFGSWGQPNP